MVRNRGTSFWVAPIGILFAAPVASCAGGRENADGPLRVADAWVRPANATGTGAMYLTLENRDTVAVVIAGAATPFARAAEFHETMEMQGMSHMNKLDSIPVARGATLTMKPGGLHIMLVDLGRSIAPGDTVPLTIQLVDGRTTTVRAIAREQ